jgi:hypothetical protein
MFKTLKPGRSLGRKLSLCSAALAALLVLCSGCDDQVRHAVRQGAFEVFSSGLDTFYSEVSSGISQGLSDLADDGQAAAQTP